jgi:hypothetical protein
MKSLIVALPLALMPLASSNAEAAPILQITITEHATIGFGFSLFTSPTDNWPGGASGASIGNGGGTGSFVADFQLPSSDLSDVYLSGVGIFTLSPSLGSDIFVAEPAEGHVLDELAFEFGPPWASLAGLSPTSSLSGDLWIVNGPPYNGGWTVGTWQASEIPEVPEPGTLMLVGTGILFGWWRRRRPKSLSRC